jgi:hypothetical protein
MLNGSYAKPWIVVQTVVGTNLSRTALRGFVPYPVAVKVCARQVSLSLTHAPGMKTKAQGLLVLLLIVSVYNAMLAVGWAHWTQ